MKKNGALLHIDNNCMYFRGERKQNLALLAVKLIDFQGYYMYIKNFITISPNVSESRGLAAQKKFPYWLPVGAMLGINNYFFLIDTSELWPKLCEQESYFCPFV